MELLKSLFEQFSCSAGTTVIKQGAPVDYLYLVLSGSVEISFKPYDGHLITITHVRQGGLFGWSAVVGSEKYTSSIIAIEDLETVRIHGDELRKLCMEHPESGRAILGYLANTVSSRWKDAHEQVKSIISSGIHSEKKDMV
jgi:CRP/FNR family cyclic AMP-dependent transcriptional regulator